MLLGSSSQKPQAESTDDLARHLLDTLGAEAAEDVCRQNHWRGVQRKLEACENGHRLSLSFV
ncbi:MAG: hypothetical protein ACPGOV_07700 [Magnetovibrionaceae bacterium]